MPPSISERASRGSAAAIARLGFALLCLASCDSPAPAPEQALARQQVPRQTEQGTEQGTQTPPQQSTQQGRTLRWTRYYGWQDGALPFLPGSRGIARGVLSPRRVWETADDPAAVAFSAPAVPSHVDALVIPVGGVGSGTSSAQVPALLARIRQSSEPWSRGVAGIAGRLYGEYPNQRIYWQVGNEINSESVARALRGRSARANDRSIIPDYAESYFAPTVVGLRQAAAGAGRDRPLILLGTIANANAPAAIRWLDSLLSYRLEGTYAPSLAGMRVADLVDVIGVHYVLTTDDRRWESTLEHIHDTWIGNGAVSGVWSTEEVGANRGRGGAGAAAALRMVARSATWWSARGLSPAQARAFVWGGTLGPAGQTARDGLDYLFQTFGDADIVAATHDGSAGLEAYQLAADTISLLIISAGPSERVLARMPVGARGMSARVIEARHFGAGQRLPGALAADTTFVFDTPTRLRPGEVITIRLIR